MRLNDATFGTRAITRMVNIAEFLVGIGACRWNVGGAVFGTPFERGHLIREIDGDG